MPLTTLAIAAGAWAWDKYGKTITDKTAGVVKGRWDKFKWKDAAEAYRKKIKKLYGTMQIMGMAEPVPLNDIFTDAYMLDKPTALSRFDIEHLKQMSADPDASPQTDRVKGLSLVRRKDNLFILGKPGAGKTTFLKHIALQAAEQKFDKIPIFISLKEWADTGSEFLLPFIVERFDICDFPAALLFVEELLKSGSAIVLFDGLDEVNQDSGQRDHQTRLINNFVDKYDQTQCLITCRRAASDYSFQPFTYIEMADFTEKQIQIFVGNWFRKDKETRDRFLAEFAKDDNKGLRDLARTPLLLTLLCLAFAETLTFPQRRVEIYEEALDALLKKWDSSRRIKRDEAYRKLSLGHKENMLACIGAETFEKSEYFIPQPELERRITDYVKNVPPHDTDEAIDGEAILKAIEAQHGIFVERARRVYSFSHLTFHEYFTAKHLVTNAAKDTLTKLVKAHCGDRRWREVFLLTTSLLPDASSFVTYFRKTVDQFLGQDKTLVSLFIWADKKAKEVEEDYELGREIYLFIADLRVSPHGSFNLKHARNLAFERARDRSRALDRNLIFDLNFDLASSLDFGSDHVHILARARKFGLNHLAQDLEALSLLDKNMPWRDVTEVRALMIKHCNIGHIWELDEEEEKNLTDYLNANHLLKDCLVLATMSPKEKQAILNSLYLPPAQAEGGQNA